MFESTRKQYLKAMGVDLYRLKSITSMGPDLIDSSIDSSIESTDSDSAEPIEPIKPIGSDSIESPEPLKIQKPTKSIESIESGPIENDLASYMAMDEAMGDIDGDDAGLMAFPVDEAPPRPSFESLVNSLDWEGLQKHISTCQNCELYKTRTQTVFGVGNPQADIMVIGEAPGADEDAKGEPFVGPAGQLLDNMLKAIGLDRNKVFIANILKCRPPSNRNPSPEEALACESYLLRQIDLISPKLILSVGGVSAKNLLKTEEAVGRLRLQKQTLVKRNIPLLVTYHPAYLLRKPSEKAKSWADLKKLRQLIKELDITIE